MTDELLAYYNSELAYIRRMGDDFAKAYPKVARRLRWDPQSCQDPHVERLIEGFAFLTARIRRKLDDDFPEIAEAFLGTLHPHFLAPVPSMSVVQFLLDHAAGKLAGGYAVPRHSLLNSAPIAGETCCYRTCYPITLWPVRTTAASLNGPPYNAPQPGQTATVQSVLRLRLETLDKETPFSALGVRTFRFFLSGQRHYMFELYELLLNHTVGIAIADGPNDPTPFAIPPECLKPVGFERDEELLPYSARTQRAYRLLTEYFVFPEKFLFLDVTGLDEVLSKWTRGAVEIYFYLDRRMTALEQQVSASTFPLGCTPIVNLFPQTAEPISLTHEASEYQVTPNARRLEAMEIYSIDRVTATGADGEARDFGPLYSSSRTAARDRDQAFWFGTRRPGRRREGQPDSGTEMFLSLADLNLDPARIDVSVVTIETTCLNRDLPARIEVGSGHVPFELQSGGPIAAIRCLTHPTPTRRPPLKKGTLWRLISHLSLNHFSITGGDEGAAAFAEILRVYDFVRPVDEPFPFEGILRVDSRRVVGRGNESPMLERTSGDLPWGMEPGFCRGIEVTLELDEEQFVGTGLFLFGAVMERFLGLYCSINSFTKLVLKSKQRGEIRRWVPRSGEKALH